MQWFMDASVNILTKKVIIKKQMGPKIIINYVKYMSMYILRVGYERIMFSKQVYKIG